MGTLGLPKWKLISENSDRRLDFQVTAVRHAVPTLAVTASQLDGTGLAVPERRSPARRGMTSAENLACYCSITIGPRSSIEV